MSPPARLGDWSRELGRIGRILAVTLGVLLGLPLLLRGCAVVSSRSPAAKGLPPLEDLLGMVQYVALLILFVCAAITFELLALVDHARQIRSRVPRQRVWIVLTLLGGAALAWGALFVSYHTAGLPRIYGFPLPTAIAELNASEALAHLFPSRPDLQGRALVDAWSAEMRIGNIFFWFLLPQALLRWALPPLASPATGRFGTELAPRGPSQGLLSFIATCLALEGYVFCVLGDLPAAWRHTVDNMSWSQDSWLFGVLLGAPPPSGPGLLVHGQLLAATPSALRSLRASHTDGRRKGRP